MSRPRALALGLAALMGVGACSRPLATGRTVPLAPTSEREYDARYRIANARCSLGLGFLFPGLSQICLREDGKGALLATLTAAEVGAAITTASLAEDENGEPDFEHPGFTLPLIAIQDLYLYGLIDGLITRQRAQELLYAPTDTLGELALAPFNLEVMKRPDVLLGLAGALALGIGGSLLISELDSSRAGDDPNIFGRELAAPIGYPAGFGIGAALFTHVAIAEEVAFRGLVQSSASRRWGEGKGWAVATAAFGLAHVPNVYAVEREDRAKYLLIGLPVITALGGYLGWLYQRSDYSLTLPVAVHFWYDLLLSTTFLILDPDDSVFSAGISLPL